MPRKNETAAAGTEQEQTAATGAKTENAGRSGAAKTGQDAPEKDAPQKDILAGLPNPCVYCGPSIRGVAMQFTTYQGGGVSKALEKFVREHPEAAGLIVSTRAFPAVQKRLRTPGTAEERLYRETKEWAAGHGYPV